MIASVDWMYPLKGILDNWILSLAFDAHNAASAQEKRQEINLTHSGLVWFLIFSLIQAFTNKMWTEPRDYIISGNPADISMYLVSKCQQASKVPRHISRTLI
jgi:hypothetical protein